MEPRKRLVCSVRVLSVVLLLTLTLSACVPVAAPAPAPAPAPTSAPAPAPTEVAPAAAPAPTEAAAPAAKKTCEGESLSVLMDDRTQNHVLRDELLPAFEKETGMKVNIDIMPESALVEKENLELSQSVGTYDVIQYIWLFNISWAKNGWLADLKPQIDDPSKRMYGFDPNNYDAPIWDLLTREGKIVGANLIASTGYMYYNKQLLDKYGVTVPTTMDEFLAAAQKCNHPEDGVYGYAGRGERGGTQNIMNWQEMVKGYGGKIFDDKWNVTLESPEAIKGTETFVKVMTESAPKGTLTAGWTEVQTMFQQGQVCFIWETNDMLSRLNDPAQSKVVGHVGTAVLPSSEDTHNGFLASWAMGVPSTSKKQECAWQFIQFATSTDVGVKAKYASTKDAIKLQYEAYPNPEGLPKIGEVIAKGFALGDPDFFPRVPEYNEWSEALAVEISNAITKQKPPAQAMTDAAKAITDVMTKAGYYKK